MKNNYFKWATWGMVFGIIYSFKKYHDDTALHIARTNMQWFMMISGYIVTYVLVVMLIMFILRRMRKDDTTT